MDFKAILSVLMNFFKVLMSFLNSLDVVSAADLAKFNEDVAVFDEFIEKVPTEE